jgi:four helix bundle protein
MSNSELQARVSQFARDVHAFTEPLFRSSKTEDVARQLRRSANGMAANYGSAGAARSPREFVSRIAIVKEEAVESQHWLQYLSSTGHPCPRALVLESCELKNIFAASYATAKRNLAKAEAARKAARHGNPSRRAR